MAYFGGSSNHRKQTELPNPRLKNCLKASQVAPTPLGLSSFQYCLSYGLLTEKSQTRNHMKFGDFILIPTYNLSYRKVQFSCQNCDCSCFGKKPCHYPNTPPKTTTITSHSTALLIAVDCSDQRASL